MAATAPDRGATPWPADELRARNVVSWSAALIGGVAGALAFEPFGLAFLIPLTPLGMFVALRTSPTPLNAFGRVFLGCYLFYLVSISWLMTLARFFPIVVLGILYVAIYMSFFPALSAWTVRRLMPGLRAGAQFVVFGALWVFWEWFRTLGELSYGWSQLGHPWAQWPVMIQPAEWLGELGVSLVSLLIAGALLATGRWWLARRVSGGRAEPGTRLRVLAEALGFDVAARDREDQGPAGGPVTAAARPAVWATGLWAVLGCLLLLSWLRLEQWERRIAAAPDETKLRVAAVQPNITQEEKMARYTLPPEQAARLSLQQDQILHELISGQVPAGLDLVVLPESVFPETFFSIDRMQQLKVLRMIEPPGADVLFGATRVTLDEDGRYVDQAWNSAWFVPAGGDVDLALVQDKMRLVPFGEHLSYFRYVPFFQTIVPMEEFSAGERVVLFETEGRKFGTLVCFESSIATQARALVYAGAEFLTVITNDAWYGRSAGASQHRNHSLIRAVETRRPVVRAANTGISILVNAAGVETAKLPLENRGVLTGEIVPQTGRTFFVRWGNLWVILGSLTAVVLGFWFGRRVS